MYNDTKNLLLSKTVWGIILSAVGTVMTSRGFDVSGLNGIDGEIVTTLGLLFALYGRVKAVKKIG